MGCCASSDMAAAAKALGAARQIGASCTRVALYLEAWVAWVEEGDLVGAAKAFAEVVRAFPRDLFALKRAQLLYFLAGDAEAMLSVRDHKCCLTGHSRLRQRH